MDKQELKYETYLSILKEELVPAMGCTEPIALAFAAAKGREILGDIPEIVLIEVSGSIIKNVKSVVVPNTNNLRGIKAAVAAGIVAGKSMKELEVISEVSNKEKEVIDQYLDDSRMSVRLVDNGYNFDIILTLKKKNNYVKIRIVDTHTNIVLIEKDGQKLYEKEIALTQQKNKNDRSLLSIESIVDFANSVDINEVKDLLDKQIDMNSKIAEEGLKGNYGANIGKILIDVYGNDIKILAKAKAAAGSDARMNGCELPVIINSGSGNQGITCSVPVIEYSKYLKSSKEELYRALVVSNLVSIHEKTGIGTLSAYCGAVCAGAGAGAGIAYINKGNLEIISHTVANALAIVSGIVCDGAKASCAAKIASSVDAGILGYNLAKNGKDFHSGDGIVLNNIEDTIKGIGSLASQGMKTTNEEIIRIMTEEE